MACGCEIYECRDVWVNPCNVGTYTGIEATSTGNYRALLEFNGAFREFGVAVQEDQDIAFLTSVLNANYVHELRLYDENDNLFGCYKLKTHLTQSVSGAPVIPPADDTWQWGQITANGNIVDSVLLTGDISPIIWVNEQPVDWVAQGIVQTGTGLDFTSIGGAFGTISFQYKNLP